MTAIRKFSICCLFILFGLLPGDICSFAQSTELDPEKWAVELSKKDDRKGETVLNLREKLVHTDSAHAFQFIDALEKNGRSSGDHFKARFYCLKAGMISLKNVYYEFYQDRKVINVDSIRKQLTELYTAAMDIAYRSEDDYLVAFVSYDYASTISVIGDIGISVMYGKNGIDLYEKLSVPVLPARYQFLAELLYRVREYSECVKYAKKAAAAWRSSPKEYKPFTVSCINTVALGYHRQKKYDSAFIFYNEALQLAKEIKDTVWTGIVSGNMGQIFYAQGKYDTAYTLLKMDYKASKAKGFYDNAANSLQWAARTDLAMDHKQAALAEVREAFQLLKTWPDPSYLRNTYYTATQVFREIGAYDSAFYYNNLYSLLNDSLEKVVATSSLAISKARLNDEASRYNIQNLNKEKRSQLLLRNIIIASIVVLSFFVVLIVNRQRLKEKLKTEKAEQEKLRMEQQKLTVEQEVASAKVQLKMFTENLVEKTSLIEKLESQVQGKQASSEQHAIISELSRQTILTEEDWQKFKSLFEKIYPGFFINLQEKVSDITVAELRMAALTRLHLSTSQIGSILGISANSVYKTRQRLRQRLNIEPEIDIEEAIAKM
ncbi:MAG: tetratricopeptide repeat protein [Bacteroidetes bacterium]|nr:MAG: tetratricopeptide repeat protein [Bacteroidota bacterium]